MEYMLCDLCWVYNLEDRNLSVFIKNSAGNKVKNIGTGVVYELYKNSYEGYILDFNKILNTSGHISYNFEQLYGLVGTDGFETLKNEAKQVEKELKKIRRDYDNYYYPHELPEIDKYQYINEYDLMRATKKAQEILRCNKDVQARERSNKNQSALNF